MRLCTVDGGRFILRCFYADERDYPEALVAPESWALEGVNYDTAKTAYEQAVAFKVARETGIDTDSRVLDLYNRLKSMTAQELVDYVTGVVVDFATARALLLRVVLLLAAKL